VITVSAAEPRDTAAIAELLADLRRFYGTPERIDAGLDEDGDSCFS